MSISVRISVRYLFIVSIICAPLAGCADSGHGKAETVQDRQDAALKDPFGYGGNTDKVDISGGDISHYDKKAMKRDLDSFFNP